MKVLNSITVDEMISVFLLGELNSPRWGKNIRKILFKNNINEKVIYNPDIKNEKENLQRKKILGEFRGYGGKDGLFDDVDESVIWKKVLLEIDDFSKIKYIDYDYWNELSEKTGFVIDGARNVKKGMEVFNVSNKQYWQIAELVKNGGTFPNLILLSDEEGNFKLLEGHVRLTGYLLNDNLKPIEVIVGFKS